VLGTWACSDGQPPRDLSLTWSDEFDGPAGSRPDPSKWGLELGGGGWGNGELQAYTDRPENVSLGGTGTLVVTARADHPAPYRYSSARLTTRSLFAQTFGHFEARMKLPTGTGLWPAFWLMGGDQAQVGWPACGEIDIMESRGAEPWRVTGSVHGPGYSGGQALVAGYESPGHVGLSDDFHVYAVDWEPNELRFSVDGDVYHTVKATRLPRGVHWVFDHPFFIIVNLAVGGYFGGPPDAETTFPQTLEVDYLRVYGRAR
jgi:beta-glucanase (GH16 family)